MKNTDARHLATLLSSNYYTVAVRFRDGNNQKLYTYKVPNDVKLEKDDMVIVDAPFSGVTIVDVKEVHTVPRINPNAPFDYKWIVAKVDLAAHRERLEREKEFAQVVAQLEAERSLEEYRAELPQALRDKFDAARAKLNG